MKTIEIIGYGVVGKGIERLFQNRFNIRIYDPEKGYPDRIPSDLSVICVPTPAKADGSCDISMVEDAVRNCESPLILIKSTVPPGTTNFLAKKYKKDVCFSPEYMGESKYYTPFWKYPDPAMPETHTFVIVGGYSASEILEYFIKVMSVDTKYVSCDAIEAELAKYMENVFFATKVTFCNEFAGIAGAYGVDYKKLRELWLLDSRINSNHTLVFEDEPGYGGKCFPKDISAIVEAAKSKGYTPKLLEAVIERNNDFRS